MKLYFLTIFIILSLFLSCDKNPVIRTAEDDYYTATVEIYTETGIHLQNAYLWCCTKEKYGDECQGFEDGRYFHPWPIPGEISVRLYHFVYQPEVLPDTLIKNFVVLISDTTQSNVEFHTTIPLYRGHEYRLVKVNIQFVP